MHEASLELLLLAILEYSTAAYADCFWLAANGARW